MKTFYNNKNTQIFYLDDDGNLTIPGIINAKNIGGYTLEIVYTSEVLEEYINSYTGKATVIYYIGEDTEEFKKGTFWEVVPSDYYIGKLISSTSTVQMSGDIKIRKDDTQNIEILNYAKSEGENFRLVLARRNTSTVWAWTTITNVETIPPEELHIIGNLNDSEYNGIFDLLTPSSVAYYFVGDTFTFAFKREYFNCHIEKIEESKIDSELFVKKAGDILDGRLITQTLLPSETDTYNLGSENFKYNNVYAKSFNGKVIGQGTFDSLSYTGNPWAGNNSLIGNKLLMVDTDKNVNCSHGLIFSNDTTKFLRQDGTFAVPNSTLALPILTTLDCVSAKQYVNQFVIGDSNNEWMFGAENSDMPRGVYVSHAKRGGYQIGTTKGIFKSIPYLGIIEPSLNTTSILATKLAELGNSSDIKKVINSTGYVILTFDPNLGWTINNENYFWDAESLSWERIKFLLEELLGYSVKLRATGTVTTFSISISKYMWILVDNDAVTMSQALGSVAIGRLVESQNSQGLGSVIEGIETVAYNEGEHAEGTYNISHSLSDSSHRTIHSIGNGTDSLARKNAVEVTQDGSVYIQGIGNYDGTTLPAEDNNVKSLQNSILKIELLTQEEYDALGSNIDNNTIYAIYS